MDINLLLEQIEGKVEKAIINGKYDDAMRLISFNARVRYVNNTSLTDGKLEKYASEIADSLRIPKRQNGEKLRDKRIVFYDGFGLDKRGIVLQYINGLLINGYQVVYVTYKKYSERIDNIVKSLEGYRESKIVFLRSDSFVDRVFELCGLIDKERAKNIFFYSKPNDIVGVIAFKSLNNICTRYLINLTDHAFWLGINSCDYFIEFRDFGGYVSKTYRKIPESKIIKLPYYPLNYFDDCFKGFPFTKGDDTVVLFSGGALYKTIDGNNTFYRIVDKCLKNNPNLVFWYAGTGDSHRINELIERYPGKVFHTSERSDLIEVLRNIDIYLNTYPQSGGLMMQYCVLVGKIPLSLKSRYSGRGELIFEDRGHLFETEDELIYTIDKMVKSIEFRNEMNSRVKGTVISQETFNKNLWEIIENKSSEFSIKPVDIDVQEIFELYRSRFRPDSVFECSDVETLPVLIKYIPVFGLTCLLQKINTKFRR